MTRAWLLALLVPLAVADAGPTEDPVLATFTGGVVRRSDVEREARFLRPDEERFREHMQLSQRASWEDWIRRAALRAMARTTADTEGLTDDPELHELARREGRDWLLGVWEKDCYGFGLTVPDDATLLAAIDAPARVAPARIRVSHLFLRSAGTADDDGVRGRLERWRSEISDDPQRFAEYARRNSQSLTARRGGLIGNVRSGALPPEVESILFALPVGVVSQPVHLHGGWHLFLVHENLPERSVPPRQELNRARAGAVREAKAACRQRRLAQSAVQREVSGEGAELQVRVGDWTVSGEVLRRVYGTADGLPEGRVERYLDEEALYQQALATEWVDPAMRGHLRDLADDVLLGSILGRRVDQFLTEPSDEDLRTFASARQHPLQQRKRMRLDVLRTPIPETGDPLAFLDSLEEGLRAVRSGELAFAALLDGLPAASSIDELPLLDVYELVGSRIEPVVFEAAKELPEGAVSEPVQLGHELYAVAVREVVPGRDKTFEEARTDLRRLWLKERRRQLRASITTTVLESFAFELTAAGKATLAALEAAPPEGAGKDAGGGPS